MSGAPRPFPPRTEKAHDAHPDEPTDAPNREHKTRRKQSNMETWTSLGRVMQPQTRTDMATKWPPLLGHGIGANFCQEEAECLQFRGQIR